MVETILPNVPGTEPTRVGSLLESFLPAITFDAGVIRNVAWWYPYLFGKNPTPPPGK
jgi:hypothetical protein